VFLVKPSKSELEGFAGRKLSREELAEEAQRLVASGKADNVALTLGGDGAVLASREGLIELPAIPVEACSTVGAGDSFVAGMVHGFALGRSAAEALRVGLAAGAAAVLSCGSELARPEDLERLVGQALSGEEVDDLGGGSDRA
jgi:6-phosphofructokinase 2